MAIHVRPFHGRPQVALPCPLPGICPTETFDVTPYTPATTRPFLRHPHFHDLPRKFKIVFSRCDDDGNWAAAGNTTSPTSAVTGTPGKSASSRRPFCQFVLGGQVYAEGAPFAWQVAVPPAQRLPQARGALIEVYQRDRVPRASLSRPGPYGPPTARIPRISKSSSTLRQMKMTCSWIGESKKPTRSSWAAASVPLDQNNSPPRHQGR